MKTSLMRTLALMFCTATPAFCEDSPQKAAKLDIEIKAQMDYWIYLPQDYEKQEKVPLLLFLHGAGERGNDLNKVKVHGKEVSVHRCLTTMSGRAMVGDS